MLCSATPLWAAARTSLTSPMFVASTSVAASDADDGATCRTALAETPPTPLQRLEGRHYLLQGIGAAVQYSLKPSSSALLVPAPTWLVLIGCSHQVCAAPSRAVRTDSSRHLELGKIVGYACRPRILSKLPKLVRTVLASPRLNSHPAPPKPFSHCVALYNCWNVGN